MMHNKSKIIRVISLILAASFILTSVACPSPFKLSKDHLRKISAEQNGIADDISKALGGPKADHEEANRTIVGEIAQGKVIKYVKEDGKHWIAYRIKYIKNYRAGKNDTGLRAPEYDLTEEESAWLNKCIADSDCAELIKEIPVLLDSAEVAWLGNLENSTLVHAGHSARRVWFGESLFKALLNPKNPPRFSRTRRPLLQEVFSHEKLHLKNLFYEDDFEDTFYNKLLEEVAALRDSISEETQDEGYERLRKSRTFTEEIRITTVKKKSTMTRIKEENEKIRDLIEDEEQQKAFVIPEEEFAEKIMGELSDNYLKDEAISSYRLVQQILDAWLLHNIVKQKGDNKFYFTISNPTGSKYTEVIVATKDRPHVLEEVSGVIGRSGSNIESYWQFIKREDGIAIMGFKITNAKQKRAFTDKELENIKRIISKGETYKNYRYQSTTDLRKQRQQILGIGRSIALGGDQAEGSSVEISLSNLEKLINAGLFDQIIDQLMYKGPSDFKKEAGLVFGRKRGNRYIVTRIVPFSEYEIQDKEIYMPDLEHVRELLDEHTQGRNIKLLGVFHTHSYTKLLKKKAPGADLSDSVARLFKEWGLWGNKKVETQPIGILFEPKVKEIPDPADIAEGHVSQGISIFTYLNVEEKNKFEITNLDEKDLLTDVFSRVVSTLFKEICYDIPKFAMLQGMKAKAKDFEASLLNRDLEKAINIWGDLMSDISDIQSKKLMDVLQGTGGASGGKQVRIRFAKDANAELFMRLSADMDKMLSRYIYAHGITSRDPIRKGKVVGVLKLAPEEKMENILNRAKGHEIFVMEYPPDRSLKIKGKGLISCRGGKHNEDVANAMGITCCIIPNAMTLLRDLEGEYVMFDITGQVAKLRKATDEEIKNIDGYKNAPPKKEKIGYPKAVAIGPRIMDLNDIDISYINFVGPKAARAGTLRQLGLNVPDGFVTTFSFSNDFFEQTGVGGAIDSIMKRNKVEKAIRKYLETFKLSNGAEDREEKQRLAKNEMENIIQKTTQADLKKLERRMANLIVSTDLPDEIFQELTEEINKRFKGKHIILRSSFNAEDLIRDTTSGLYDSSDVIYVPEDGIDGGVRGRILGAWKRVIASMWSPRAVRWRMDNAISYKEVIPAVFIMEAMPARWGAAVDTANRVNGDHSIMDMQACHGNPAAILSDEYGSGRPAKLKFSRIKNRLLQKDESESIQFYSEKNVMINEEFEPEGVEPELMNSPVFDGDTELVERIFKQMEIAEQFFGIGDGEILVGDQIWFAQFRPNRHDLMNETVLVNKEQGLNAIFLNVVEGRLGPTCETNDSVGEKTFEELKALTQAFKEKNIQLLLNNITHNNLELKVAALTYLKILLINHFDEIRAELEDPDSLSKLLDLNPLETFIHWMLPYAEAGARCLELIGILAKSTDNKEVKTRIKKAILSNSTVIRNMGLSHYLRNMVPLILSHVAEFEEYREIIFDKTCKSGVRNEKDPYIKEESMNILSEIKNEEIAKLLEESIRGDDPDWLKDIITKKAEAIRQTLARKQDSSGEIESSSLSQTIIGKKQNLKDVSVDIDGEEIVVNKDGTLKGDFEQLAQALNEIKMGEYDEDIVYTKEGLEKALTEAIKQILPPQYAELDLFEEDIIIILTQGDTVFGRSPPHLREDNTIILDIDSFRKDLQAVLNRVLLHEALHNSRQFTELIQEDIENALGIEIGDDLLEALIEIYLSFEDIKEVRDNLSEKALTALKNIDISGTLIEELISIEDDRKLVEKIMEAIGRSISLGEEEYKSMRQGAMDLRGRRLRVGLEGVINQEDTDFKELEGVLNSVLDYFGYSLMVRTEAEQKVINRIFSEKTKGETNIFIADVDDLGKFNKIYPRAIINRILFDIGRIFDQALRDKDGFAYRYLTGDEIAGTVAVEAANIPGRSRKDDKVMDILYSINQKIKEELKEKYVVVSLGDLDEKISDSVDKVKLIMGLFGGIVGEWHGCKAGHLVAFRRENNENAEEASERFLRLVNDELKARHIDIVLHGKLYNGGFIDPPTVSIGDVSAIKQLRILREMFPSFGDKKKEKERLLKICMRRAMDSMKWVKDEDKDGILVGFVTPRSYSGTSIISEEMADRFKEAKPDPRIPENKRSFLYPRIWNKPALNAELLSEIRDSDETSSVTVLKIDSSYDGELLERLFEEEDDEEKKAELKTDRKREKGSFRLKAINELVGVKAANEQIRLIFYAIENTLKKYSWGKRVKLGRSPPDSGLIYLTGTPPSIAELKELMDQVRNIINENSEILVSLKMSAVTVKTSTLKSSERALSRLLDFVDTLSLSTQNIEKQETDQGNMLKQFTPEVMDYFVANLNLPREVKDDVGTLMDSQIEEAIRLLEAAGKRRESGTSRNVKRLNYDKVNTLMNNLSSDNYYDVIIIAAKESQVELFKNLIKVAKEKEYIPQRTPCVVVPEPDDKALGDLGGIINAFEKADDLLEKAGYSLAKFKKKAMIMAGGSGQSNYPFTLAAGGNTSFLPLPNGEPVFFHTLRQIVQYLDRTSQGTIVFPNDGINIIENSIIFDNDKIQVMGVVNPGNYPHFDSLGAMVLDKKGNMKKFYEKSGRFTEDDSVPTSWGIYFIPKKAETALQNAYSELLNKNGSLSVARDLFEAATWDSQRWAERYPDKVDTEQIQRAAKVCLETFGFGFVDVGVNSFASDIGIGNGVYLDLYKSILSERELQRILRAENTSTIEPTELKIGDKTIAREIESGLWEAELFIKGEEEPVKVRLKIKNGIDPDEELNLADGRTIAVNELKNIFDIQRTAQSLGLLEIAPGKGDKGGTVAGRIPAASSAAAPPQIAKAAIGSLKENLEIALRTNLFEESAQKTNKIIAVSSSLFENELTRKELAIILSKLKNPTCRIWVVNTTFGGDTSYLEDLKSIISKCSFVEFLEAGDYYDKLSGPNNIKVITVGYDEQGIRSLLGKTGRLDIAVPKPDKKTEIVSAISIFRAAFCENASLLKTITSSLVIDPDDSYIDEIARAYKEAATKL